MKIRRWTRIGISLLMAGIFLGGWLTPARAGGNWIEWDREFYAPGETVVGRLESLYPPPPPEQTFFAYLRADSDRWRDGPPVPPDTLFLGEIELIGEQTARLVFVMPDVPPGRYDVYTCNDPCTRSVGVDLSWINVVRTPVEASTRERLVALRMRVGIVKHRISRVSRSGQANDDSILELRQDIKGLAREVSHLKSAVEDLQDRETAPPAAEKNDLSAPLMIVVAAALGGIVVVRRRRIS